MLLENALKKCPKNAFKINLVKNSKKKKNHFKMTSITQNTFYTYGPAFRNTRKKNAFASKSQTITIITIGVRRLCPHDQRHSCINDN